jgi:transposase
MTKTPVEVITSVQRRRRRSQAKKERVVATAMEPGAIASEVARAAGIQPSQLFRWRQQLCERTQTLAVFNAVTVTPEAGAPSSPSAALELAPAKHRPSKLLKTIPISPHALLGSLEDSDLASEPRPWLELRIKMGRPLSRPPHQTSVCVQLDDYFGASKNSNSNSAGFMSMTARPTWPRIAIMSVAPAASIASTPE